MNTVSNLNLHVGPFIDGKLLASMSDQTHDVICPSTGQKFLFIPTGCEQDVDRAVSSARTAFEDGRWSEMPPSFKKKTLTRFADLIEEQAATLDALDAEEMGKPLSASFGDASSAAGAIRFCAEAVDKITGDVLTSDNTSVVTVGHVPRGVVASVAPWNFPTFNAAGGIASALAAGNSVVLKPSELSSRSAIHLAQMAVEAGLPEGVFNVVPGVGETVGRALGLHMDVDMLIFTGSTAVGRLMLQYAGQSNMKVVATECGGKSPQIVFADGVDLDAAADTIAQSILMNQGQVCSAGSRLLVQQEIETELIEKIVSRFKKTVVGNALDPNTTFGPIVTEKQCKKVMQYIQSGLNEGAQLVTGGNRLLPETGGYFVEPTLLRHVQPDTKIAQEEIFGPVLSAISFKDEEDAIRIANSTVYGLVSSVWTSNLSTGMRLSKKIHAGMVFVNAASPAGEGAGNAISFEPYGLSGVGVAGGIAGIEACMRRQLNWVNHG